MKSRENLSYFPKNTFHHKQFSSYNRASITTDEKGWFENNDMSHFLREDNNNGRREFVMFDAEGPGAIVRWWMTFYKAQNGIIRIYIDNNPLPLITGSPSDILCGSAITESVLAESVQAGAEIGEAGRAYDYNFYVPIPFKEHCKITYECDSIVTLFEYEGTPVPTGYLWPDVFYNIGYRAYSENTNMVSVTLDEFIKQKKLIDQTGNSLMNTPFENSQTIPFEKVLTPGDSLLIEIPGNNTAVSRMLIDLQSDDNQQSLRSTVISSVFDNYQTIWAPVGEFFGTGYSLNPHKTFMNRRNEDRTMESFWVMPFRKKCVMTFINYGSEEVKLKGEINLCPYKWKNNSMYFGSAWHELRHVKTRTETGSPFDLNFIDMKGKGVYVGDQISLFNNSYQWWGEGDEKIFVDGEIFPSSFGTGSEDYYGYSFARPEPFSHPFLSQPEGKGNTYWGLTVNMRHRSLDAIPFETSISSNIELWHWADILMNYSLTTYFYLQPPFTINVRPDAESVRYKVALKKNDIPEIENMKNPKP